MADVVGLIVATSSGLALAYSFMCLRPESKRLQNAPDLTNQAPAGTFGYVSGACTAPQPFVTDNGEFIALWKQIFERSQTLRVSSAGPRYYTDTLCVSFALTSVVPKAFIGGIEIPSFIKHFDREDVCEWYANALFLNVFCFLNFCRYNPVDLAPVTSADAISAIANVMGVHGDFGKSIVGYKTMVSGIKNNRFYTMFGTLGPNQTLINPEYISENKTRDAIIEEDLQFRSSWNIIWGTLGVVGGAVYVAARAAASRN